MGATQSQDLREERRLRIIRENNREARLRAREAGELQVTVMLHRSLIDVIDRVKAGNDLPNRSKAITQILSVLLDNADTKKELGL